jgi:multiple sugar transport system permease protein
MKWNKWFVYPSVLLIMLAFLFPIYWMILTSFKTNDVLMKFPPEWVPLRPTLINFVNIFSDNRFLTFYLNTIIVALSTTVLSLILSVCAGYSFSRFRFPGSKILQILILSAQMFPAVVLLIAIYTLYRKLNLLNTYTALILACATNALPLSIWVLKGFFDTIPRSLEEAALIDGCGRFQTLVKIILPLVKPGILAIAMYGFLISWDDYLWSLTLVNKLGLRTLSAGIALSYLGEYAYDWSKVMAAAVAASIPVLVIFIFVQKQMITGMTTGAIRE